MKRIFLIIILWSLIFVNSSDARKTAGTSQQRLEKADVITKAIYLTQSSLTVQNSSWEENFRQKPQIRVLEFKVTDTPNKRKRGSISSGAVIYVISQAIGYEEARVDQFTPGQEYVLLLSATTESSFSNFVFGLYSPEDQSLFSNPNKD